MSDKLHKLFNSIGTNTLNNEQTSIEIIEEYKSKKLKILMHCFTGSEPFAKILNKFNTYFSASGIITFKNSFELQSTFKSINEDRLFLRLGPILFKSLSARHSS